MEGRAELETFKLTVESGSEAIVSRFGGQLLSWKINGEDMLFDNPAAIYDGGAPIRGGIPICFPWFSKGVELGSTVLLEPSHGVVRNRLWDLVESENDRVVLKCLAASSAGIPLIITAVYQLSSAGLLCEMNIVNTGQANAIFDLCLHTYFATRFPEEVVVEGIVKEGGSTLAVQPPIDKVFAALSSTVQVIQKERTIQIENRGFNKIVVWNPGNSKPKDLPINPVIPEFICVESLTDPLMIESGKAWEGSVAYSVREP